MRKLTLLSLLSLLIVFVVASCTKEGPEGPVGASGAAGPAGSTGAPGPTGPAGPAGTANVIYSPWFVLPTSPTSVWGDSTTVWLGDVSRAIKSAPGVTQAVIDQGVVLAYVNTSATGQPASVYPLPWNVPNPVFFGETLQVGYILAPSKIIFYLADLIFPDMTGFGITTPFRYVIIPGGVAGGRGTTPRYNGYTAAELKTMSYQQVAGIFNIPADGTNIR